MLQIEFWSFLNEIFNYLIIIAKEIWNPQTHKS